MGCNISKTINKPYDLYYFKKRSTMCEIEKLLGTKLLIMMGKIKRNM